MSRSTSCSAAIIALALLSTSCAYWPGLFASQTWYEVKTTHFTVFSNSSEQEATELARDLERFRRIVEFVIRNDVAPAPVPTYVFAFDRVSEYARVQPGRNYAAYFRSNARNNSLVFPMRRLGGLDPTHSYQHEYVHFLFRSQAQIPYPSCYEEGFAELLGTTSIKRTKVEIGRAPRRALTGWTPLERLFPAKPVNSSEYYQCWGLVHYLSFSDVQSDAITQYMKERERGESVADAAQLAFGMSIDELDERVHEYLKELKFGYITSDAARFDVETEPTARQLPANEALLRLADLMVQLERPSQAQPYFARVSEEEPDNARAWAGMGDIALLESDYETAQKHYDRMLELAPDDPITQLDYGNQFMARSRESESDEERNALTARARTHITRAWKLDDTLPEVYAAYGYTFIDGPNPEKGREALEHANLLLPGNVSIQLGLAQLYKDLGETQLARKTLHRTVAGSHSAVLPDWAKALMKEREEAAD